MTSSYDYRPITVGELVYIHDEIVLRYGGGRPGIRYLDSLHYAADLPFMVLFDQEQYPGSFLKAAVLAERIIRGHPFTDGNKRTGYLAAITLLEVMSGLTVEAEDEEAIEVCLAVEAGKMSAEELAEWMGDHADPIVNAFGELPSSWWGPY